jgi:hypothetical protein
VVVCKTLIYGSAVIVFGISERIVHSARIAGDFPAGVNAVIAK